MKKGGVHGPRFSSAVAAEHTQIDILQPERTACVQLHIFLPTLIHTHELERTLSLQMGPS